MATLVLVNPSYVGLVRRHRLDDFDHVMRKLVRGGAREHADRNVHELRLDEDGGPVRLFLKREYKTSLRGRLTNWLAGFGRATRSRREWYVLLALIEAGIGCAEPVVYGERALFRPAGYLIVREIERSMPLTVYLRERSPHLRVRDRRQLAAHLGHEVARMHEAGITHPDLYSKHVFLCDSLPAEGMPGGGVLPSSGSPRQAPAQPFQHGVESFRLPAVAFLDLQRGGIRWSVSLQQRAVDLAALDATLSAEAASAMDRLTFLQSYLSHIRATFDLRTLIAAVRARVRKLAAREKIRNMCVPTFQAKAVC